MGQLRLEGSFDAGPPSATSDSFPGASFSVPLRFRENTKAFTFASGVLQRRLNSVGSFVPIQGVGPDDSVTKGTFLYLRSDASFSLRLTTDDGSGGSVVTTFPVGGFCMLELDPLLFLKLLEAKGSANLEYFVSGVE